MLAHVLTFFEGDQKVIKDHLKFFRETTPAELVNLYNKEQKCGITGVRAQALYLYAMHQAFKEKFYDSPIVLDDMVLELTQPISLVDGKIRPVTENPFMNKDIPDPSIPRGLLECKTVEFVSRPTLSFVFFCLVVRIGSIYRLHNDPLTLIEEHFPIGEMNKDLLAMVSMSFPGQVIGRIINDVLDPLGFKYNEDYAVIQEDQPQEYIEGKTNHVFLPNLSCRDIPWLGSVVTDGGNFIWLRK